MKRPESTVTILDWGIRAQARWANCSGTALSRDPWKIIVGIGSCGSIAGMEARTSAGFPQRNIDIMRQAPRGPEKGAWKFFDSVLQFRAMVCHSLPHRDVPENGVHGGGKQLANHRASDNPEKMKRLQLGENRRGKQGQPVNVF